MKDKNTLRWIAGAFVGRRLAYAFLLLISAVKGGITVFLALAIKWTVNAAERGADNLWFYAFILVTVAVLELIAQMAMRFLREKIRYGVEVGMKNSLFRTVLVKDYAAVSAYHSGDLLNRISSDTAIVAGQSANILPQLVLMITRLFGAVGVMAFLNPLFTLLLVGGGLFVFIAASAFRKMMKRLHKSVREADGKARSYMQEAVENQLAVKVFNAEDKVAARSARFTDDYFAKRLRNERLSIGAESAFNLFFSLSYAGALIWGAFAIARGEMDYGTLMAVLQLVSQVQVPIIGLSGILPGYYAMLASAERLIEIENIKDAKALPVLADVDAYYEKFKCVEFGDVTFSYGREPVLVKANFTVEKGEFVVIRGISGIGKSTVLKLMLGVYEPNSGRIVYRSADGERGADGVRGLSAFVPQGNMLFSGTVRENICFAAEADEATVRAALDASQASAFIDDLPEGLDTKVGENGYGLSEGQIQRIAVARALLTGAPLLLLDEATSALDAVTEERMLESVRALGKTVVLVTHKSKAISFADKIIDIEDGRVSVHDNA